MSLDEHYLFSEPFPQRMGDTDKTVAAEDAASGVLVVIHLLAGGNSPANQEQLRIARELPPASVRLLREIGEHRGTPYVVTEPLPNNLSFRAWLGQVTGREMPAPEPKPPAASDPDANKFRRQVWKVPTAPPPMDQPQPGEFTQMLRTGPEPAAPKVTPPPPPQAPPMSPAPPPQQSASEFTQMLQAQGYAQPQPKTPPPAPPAAAPPTYYPPAEPPARPPTSGEFTQLMQAATGGTVRPAAAPAPPPPMPPMPPPAPAPTAASEFTLMLQNPALAQGRTQSPVQPQASPPADYERTMLFGTPGAPKPEPVRGPAALDFGSAPPQSSPPERGESPLRSSEPGEFTRMLQSPMAPSPQAPLFSAGGEPVVDRTPGGFTQLFDSQFSSPDPSARTYAPTPAPSFPMAQPAPPPASPLYPPKSAARDLNEFDRLFSEPNAPPAGGSSTAMYAAPQGAPPAAPAQPQGPSEYTLMFKKPGGGPAAPPTPAAPAPLAVKPAAAAPAVKPPATYMTLIIVLGGLLVVAIAVVAYLLMKK